MKNNAIPRIVIIGAGPTGLGAAYRLTELGHDNFSIYERNPYVGGLSASMTDPQGFVWDFAVHVEHSHYAYVDRLMETLLPDGFYSIERRSWIREYNSWIPYPFQYNFRHLPPGPCKECLQGLLRLEHQCRDLKTNDESQAKSFRTWMDEVFGEGITRHFMLPYNKKNWSIDPSLMGSQWLGDRVPVVDIERVKRNLKENRDDVQWGPNHVFKFPRVGGTGAIWNSMASRLPPQTVHLSSEVVGIDVQQKTIRLSNGETDYYDFLVSSLPLPVLARQMADLMIQEWVQSLKYTHVYVIGFALPMKMPASLQDKSWIYCPDINDLFYRVTPFSNFSPAHVPSPERYCSFLCEISRPGDEPLREPHMFVEGVLRDMRKSGILDASMNDVHVFPMVAEYGYPIPTLDRDDHLNRIMPRLQEMNIVSRGRFGGWKYEVANMDHSVMQGVEAVERILGVGDERTWYSPNEVNAGVK